MLGHEGLEEAVVDGVDVGFRDDDPFGVERGAQQLFRDELEDDVLSKRGVVVQHKAKTCLCEGHLSVQRLLWDGDPVDVSNMCGGRRRRVA